MEFLLFDYFIMLIKNEDLKPGFLRSFNRHKLLAYDE